MTNEMEKDIKTSSEIKNMTLSAKQDSKEKRPRQEKRKKLESLAEFILAIISGLKGVDSKSNSRMQIQPTSLDLLLSSHALICQQS